MLKAFFCYSLSRKGLTDFFCEDARHHYRRHHIVVIANVGNVAMVEALLLNETVNRIDFYRFVRIFELALNSEF